MAGPGTSALGTSIGLTITPRDYTSLLVSIGDRARARKDAEAQERKKEKKDKEALGNNALIKWGERQVYKTVSPKYQEELNNFSSELYKAIESDADNSEIVRMISQKSSILNELYSIGERHKEVVQKDASGAFVTTNTGFANSEFSKENSDKLMAQGAVLQQAFGLPVDPTTFAYVPYVPIRKTMDAFNPTDEEIQVSMTDGKPTTEKIVTGAGLQNIDNVVYTPGDKLANAYFNKIMDSPEGVPAAWLELVKRNGISPGVAFAQVEKWVNDQNALPENKDNPKTFRDGIVALRTDIWNKEEKEDWINSKIKKEKIQSKPVVSSGSGTKTEGTPSHVTDPDRMHFTPDQLGKIRKNEAYKDYSEDRIMEAYADPKKRQEITTAAGGEPIKAYTVDFGSASNSANFTIGDNNYRLVNMWYDPGTKKIYANGQRNMTIAGGGVQLDLGQFSSQTFEMTAERLGKLSNFQDKAVKGAIKAWNDNALSNGAPTISQQISILRGKSTDGAKPKSAAEANTKYGVGNWVYTNGEYKKK